MRNLTVLFALTFSVMSSSTSFAEWTSVGAVDGHAYYVDFEKIRKNDGYVYWWILIDHSKATKDGDWSGQTYQQGDCKSFKFKVLGVTFYKKPMGRGTGEIDNKPDKNWTYPDPKSGWWNILKTVCRYTKYTNFGEI